VLAVELYGLMEEEIAIVEAFESRMKRKEAKGTNLVPGTFSTIALTGDEGNG
jgi:hypothetical protein